MTEATATDQNTLLAEISRLMAVAEQARGRYVRLADRAARLYAPAVHVLGAATFFGWLMAGHGWEPALTAAIAVLIITCPCALALAVPAVQVAATEPTVPERHPRQGTRWPRAAGGDRHRRLRQDRHADTRRTRAGARDGQGTEIPTEILARAAAIAAGSRHPYARAVCRAATAAGLTVHPATNIREVVRFRSRMRRGRMASSGSDRRTGAARTHKPTITPPSGIAAWTAT